MSNNININYVRKVFETSEATNSNGLDLALAKLQVTDPIPEPMTERSLMRFIIHNYDVLTVAWRLGSRDEFMETLEKCARAFDAE